jgi:hypothetical protein
LYSFTNYSYSFSPEEAGFTRASLIMRTNVLRKSYI